MDVELRHSWSDLLAVTKSCCRWYVSAQVALSVASIGTNEVSTHHHNEMMKKQLHTYIVYYGITYWVGISQSILDEFFSFKEQSTKTKVLIN